jgi:hypothetical protein
MRRATLSDYWGTDKFSQAEKRKEVVRDTLMHRAAADAELLNSGRFAKEQATTVVGASPSAPVPQQPPNSPWAYADRNVEPPFDMDISAVEPILDDRRSATSANGLTSAVDASAPEEPNDGIAVGSSTPTASGVVGSYDAGTVPATSVASPGVVGAREEAGRTVSSQPSRKSFRRF